MKGEIIKPKNNENYNVEFNYNNIVQVSILIVLSLVGQSFPLNKKEKYIQ